MIEVSSLKLSQFFLRSTVSDGISRSVQISNRIFLSLNTATVVTPFVLRTSSRLQTNFVVQPSTLLPVKACHQQSLSLRTLLGVWGKELRITALTVVQQLGANRLVRLINLINAVFRQAIHLAQLSLSRSSNLYPVQRLLNQLPLQQESGA